MEKIRGVNLGGWLVLEKWMTPELYAGSEAEDEYNLLLQLGENAQQILKIHRDTFITEDDFKWISDAGINSVRLPVGHWLFNGVAPYISASEYVDWAFKMAEKYDITVLLDIHAAPGCQNGFDNGGLSGIMDWHKNPENIDKTIAFAEELAKRYHNQSSLLGIQLLNEPHWDVPIDIIQDYYTRAYFAVRRYLEESKLIVIHDGFRLNEWKEFMQEDEYKNVVLDTHFYQCFTDEDMERSPEEHIVKALLDRRKEIEEMKSYFPIIVGEWSLGIHPKSLENLSDLGRKAFERAYASSQLLAYDSGAGWYFWSYKLSEIGNQSGWDFSKSVKNGAFPNKF